MVHMSKEKKAEYTGAVSWSVLEGAMEQFAFPTLYQLPPPYDVIPPLDKGLLPLGGAGIMAVGKKEKVEYFGRGAAVYGMGAFINELTRRMLLRNLGQFRVRTATFRFNGNSMRTANGRYGTVRSQSVAMSSGGAGKYGKAVPLQPVPVIRPTYPRR